MRFPDFLEFGGALRRAGKARNRSVVRDAERH